MAATQLLGRALVTGTMIVGSVLAPATATALPATAPESATDLRLTVAPSGESQRTAVLICSPPGGSHPDASTACGTLRAANGNFRAIDTGSGKAVCPMVYSPVSVKASGTWRGSPVVYQETFDNACLLSAKTGAVFRF